MWKNFSLLARKLYFQTMRSYFGLPVLLWTGKQSGDFDDIGAWKHYLNVYLFMYLFLQPL